MIKLHEALSVSRTQNIIWVLSHYENTLHIFSDESLLSLYTEVATTLRKARDLLVQKDEGVGGNGLGDIMDDDLEKIIILCSTILISVKRNLNIDDEMVLVENKY